MSNANSRSHLTSDDGGNFWTRLSNPMKIAVVGVAVLVLVGVIVGITLGVKSKGGDDGGDSTTIEPSSTTAQPNTSTAGPTTTTVGPNPTVCEDAACNEAAELYKANMKDKNEPCEDFYEYACGNFENHNKLPGDKGRFTTFDQISDQVRTLLIKTLESKAPEKENSALKFIRTMYAKLTDQSFLEKNDLSKLKKLNEDIHKSKNAEEAIITTVTGALPSLFSFGFDQDPEDTTKRIIVLDQPTLTVSRKDLVANDTDENAKNVRKAYAKYVSASLQLFNKKPDGEGDDDEEFNADAVADDILKLEIELAKISTPEEERRDYSAILKRFEKEKLKDEVEGIDLAKIVDEVLGERKKYAPVVIIADLPFFKNLSKVLNENAAWKDFLTWKLVQKYGWVLSDQVNKESFEFLKVKNGLKEQPKQNETVLNTLINQVPNVMGRFYVDAAGFGQEDIDKISELVKKLQESMKSIIEKKDWMDEKTKEAAKKKLDAMKVNIGYPQWIKNDTELKKSFNIKLRAKDDAFTLYSKFSRWAVNDNINKINETVDPEREWPMSAALVNAAYSPSQNSITFPAAILRGVFYGLKKPDYANYAAIGTVIGHEITHGFDDQGAQFGPDGKLDNWWSDETKKAFKEAADKMVKQYSEIVDTQTGLNLNGVNTQGENIADNGAITEALKAYMSLNVEDEKLKHFETWSNEKMFFLSYANQECGMHTKESLRQSILNDPHAPGRYRVNVPLANSPEFAKAFNCKEGAKMNPKDRVIVW